MGIVVIVAYKPKAGKGEQLKKLTKTHVPRLKMEGLVTDREPVILETADGTIVEIFEWLSEEAIKLAHQNPAVHQMWAEYGEVCDYIPLKDLPETNELFASFKPIN